MARAIDMDGVPPSTDLFVGETLTLRDKIALYVLVALIRDHSEARLLDHGDENDQRTREFNATTVVGRAFAVADKFIECSDADVVLADEEDE